MPKILAIETATEACSAALIIHQDGASVSAVDTEQRVITRFKLAPREHTKLILPMIEKVLKVGGCTMNDIDAIAFGRGPGAFTGLRIAAGIAQGLALSIDKPVIPVSTLSALALQARLKSYSDETIIAGLDARMDEVYWGVFEFKGDDFVLIGDEKVSKMHKIGEYINQSTNIDFIGIGSAWDAYSLEDNAKKPAQTLKIIKNAFPAAAEIANLALKEFIAQRTVAIEDAQPVYIRNNVADKLKKHIKE